MTDKGKGKKRGGKEDYVITSKAGNHRNRRRASNEAGQVLLIMVLALVVLIGSLALATDVGYWRYVRRDMQKAADAGAIGGAHQLLDGGSVVDWAQYDAKKNGYDVQAEDTLVTVNNPPKENIDPKHSTNQYVEVIIEQDKPTFFAKIFNINSVKVRARAIAYAGQDFGPPEGCVYALSPTADHGLHVSGSNTEVNLNCQVLINSSTDNALLVSGNSILNTTGITVVGGYDISSAETVTPPEDASNFTSGEQGETVNSVEDPLKQYLPNPPPPVPPDVPCEYNNYDVGSGTTQITLNPGVYCGGIKVTTSADLVFNPGLYTIYGGGMEINASADITGYGVTFYNYGDGGQDDGVTVNAGAGLILHASDPQNYPNGEGNPSSIPGFLFWQDENNTSNATFTAKSSSQMEGYLYFPGANNVKFTGNNGTYGLTTTVVAQTVKFAGGANFDFENYTAGGSGGSSPPIPRVVLVE